MFYWALLVLVITIVCVLGMSRRKGATRKPIPLLDFSVGQAENKVWASILQRALAASQTDSEFEQAIVPLLVREDPMRSDLDAEHLWLNLLGRFNEYRHMGEFETKPRVLAERSLADTTRHIKK